MAEPSGLLWAIEIRLTQLEDQQRAIREHLMTNSDLLEKILRAISAQQAKS